MGSVGDTTYAGQVRSAASSLGIVAADPRARPLWEQCQTAPGPECAGERGRTQLLVKMIKFHGPTVAEAQVSLDVVGSGPTPLQSGGSLWGQLFLGKEDGEWMVTGTGVMIVS